MSWRMGKRGRRTDPDVRFRRYWGKIFGFGCGAKEMVLTKVLRDSNASS